MDNRSAPIEIPDMSSDPMLPPSDISLAKPNGREKKSKPHKARRLGSKVVPLEQALTEYAAVRRDPTAKIHSTHVAFFRLATAFGARGSEAYALVENAQELDPDSEFRRAVALELSFTSEALRESRGASAEWGRSSVLWQWELYATLSASAWITARDLWIDASESILRRVNIQPLLKSSIGRHPLYRTDSSGYWAPGTRDEDAGSWSANATESDLSDDSSLPLATELRTRRDILRLAQLDPEAERKHVQQHKLGMKLLNRILDTQRTLIEKPRGDQDERVWLLCSRISGAIGRQPEVWGALTRGRHALIALGKVGLKEAEAERWADAVAATWCSAPESLDLLEHLAADNLPHLIRGARDKNARTLLKSVKQVIEPRALGSPQDEALWANVARIADISPIDGDWVDGLTTRRRAVLDRHPAIEAAEEWDEARLASPDFRALAASGKARAALPAMAIAKRRLDDALETRDTILADAEAAHLRQLIERANLLPVEVQNTLGVIPRDLGEIVKASVNSLQCLLSEVVTLIPQHEQPVRRFVADADPWQGDSLVTGLQELEFDPRRTVKDAADIRRCVRARLIADVRSRSDTLSRVAAMIADLPPEAVGLVWEVGVGLRDEQLLKTAGAVIGFQPWGQRILNDTILRFGGIDTGPIPLDDAVAEVTLGSLFEDIFRNSRDRALDRDLERISREALSVLGSLKDYIELLISDLQQIGRRLTEDSRRGSSSRN